VVENVNLQELAGPDEIAGDFDVGFGGRGIPAGMVVRENDGGSTLRYRQGEHLPRVNEDGVQGSLRDGVRADETAPGVEENDREGLNCVETVLFP